MIEATEIAAVALLSADEPPPLAPANGEVVDLVPPPLSQDEETFALALVETAGNIAAAYRMAFGEHEKFPLARGRELAAKAGIILKVQKLTSAIEEASLISVGAHLDQLARIRDLSIVTNQLSTALAAERSRGEAVGIYQRHDKGRGGAGTAIQINITQASKHDETI